MFFIFYGLSYFRFRRLKEYYENYGFSFRIYGNIKRLFSNIFFYVVVEDVNVFFINYVEENAISFFGRILGYKDEDIKFLFFYGIKMGVWRSFEIVCKVFGK